MAMSSSVARSRSSFTSDLVVAVAQGHLAFGGVETELEGLRGLGAATHEPLTQDIERRRLDENENRLGEALLDGQGPLDVDLQDEGLPGGQVALDLAGKRAVTMVVHLRPLDEVAGLDARGELIVGQEIVIDAVHLTGAWAPRGSGNRQAQAGDPIAHARDKSALPCA